MKFIILGCGSSLGVPKSNGDFGKCDPREKKNYRTRCSALIKTKKNTILIDTSPDLRMQLLNNDIKKIDKVLYSHMHADQTHGINDLRIFFMKNKKTIPVYADKPTMKYLLTSFSYCFKKTFQNYPPILDLNLIKEKMHIQENKKKIIIDSIKVKHGKINSICYRINKKLAYISDVSEIEKKNFHFFKGLKFLVIDCLKYTKHPSHFNLDQSLELVSIFKPKKTFLTNLHSDLDYNVLKKKLPKNVEPAFDGLKINL